MQSQLKILFIDDHVGLRDSLSISLQKMNPLFKFYLAADMEKAIVCLKSNKDIEIAIVDLNLNGQDGLALVDQLRQINPQIKIIIYTMYNDPMHIQKSLEKNIQGFDNRAKSAILKYSWPGNIRELKNCVESAVVMCTGDEIKIEDLPATVREKGEEKVINIPVGMKLDDAELLIIQENLAFCNGNESKCAELLGIGRKTLHRKLGVEE